MKFFYFFIALITLNLSAQEITGKWYGVLKIQGTELRLDFNIEKTETGYTSSMDSPDQGALGPLLRKLLLKILY